MELMIGSARGASMPTGEAQVSEQPFYVMNWTVIHPVSSVQRHGLCLGMRRVCAGPFRYSQPKRADIYKRGTNFKGKNGEVCYCDCSSTITQLIRENCHSSFPDSYTGNLVSNCQRTGLFQIYLWNKNTKLYNGDILVYRENGHGHTVIVTHGGIKNVDKQKK